MAIHQILERANVESALSDTSEMPVQNKVIKTALDTKVNNTYAATESGKVLGINSLGKVVPTVAGGSLPTATENGTALIYHDGEWKIQTGYGYLSPEVTHFNQAGYSVESYSTSGFVEIPITQVPGKIGTLQIFVDDDLKGEYERIENDGKYYYGVFERSTWTPVLTEEAPIMFKNEGGTWYIAANTALTSVTLALKSPESNQKISGDFIPAVYNTDTMEFGKLYMQGNNGKADGVTVDDLTSDTLTTTAKKLVEAINENKATIQGITGGVHIEVVDELPTTMTDNTIYYVMQTGSEPPIYDIKLHTTGTTIISLGTTQVDLNAYVKKANDSTFSISAGTKALTNDATAGWLKWDGVPLVTDTLRDYGFTNSTSTARWNININNYSHAANDYIVEERIYGAKRTFDGGDKYGFSRVTEIVNCNGGATIAIEEFTQHQNANLTAHNVWVKKFYYGKTSGDFSGTPVSETEWIRIKAPVEDNLTTGSAVLALSAKQGMLLSQNKQDRYIGKDKAGKNLVVDENGYITAEDTIYSIKIYKNKSETSGEGVVEVSSTKTGLDLSTYEARLAVIQKYARHCLVTKGMKNITYVKEDNFEQDLNGNAVALDGTMGDFMLEVDKLYWKCYDKTDYFEWKFSTYSFDTGCMCNCLYNGMTRKHRYIGVFLPTSADGITYDSVSINTAAYSSYMQTIYERARAGGSTMGTNNTYGLFCTPDVIMLTILSMFLYATKDIQSAAKGAASITAVNMDFSATGGWTQGTTDDYTHGSMIMGITNLYGNYGIILPCAYVQDRDAGYNKDLGEWYNPLTIIGKRTSWVWAGIGMAGSSDSNYVKNIYGGNTYMPSAPESVTGASATTYFCDGSLGASGMRMLRWGQGTEGAMGLFGWSIYNSLDNANWIRSRLTMCSVD